MKLAVYALVGTTLSLACKKSDSGPFGPTYVTLNGSIAVPAQMKTYPVLDQTGRRTAIAWQSCPSTGNGTQTEGPFTVIHSQTGCADEQHVYFENDEAVDLSLYAGGKIEILLEASAGQMTLEAFVQDNETTISNTINLVDYGFDPNEAAVNQKVSLPVTALSAGTNLNLAQMKRLLHLKISCQSANCYLMLKKIQWIGGPTEASSLTSICPKKGCPISKNSFVRFYKPTVGGWSAVSPTVFTLTNDEGKFSLFTDKALLDPFLNENIPIILAASEDGSDITFMYSLTETDLVAEAEITIDLESSVHSTLQCPGGLYPPPSGGYCYELTDDQRTTLDESLSGLFASESVNPISIAEAAGMARADAGVSEKLVSVLGEGLSAITPEDLNKILEENSVPPPTSPATNSASIPENFAAGNYKMETKVCAAGTCNTNSTNVAVTEGQANEIVNAIKDAFSSSQSSCTGSVTCTDSYSGFNGSSFSASRSIAACSEGVCAYSSIVIKLVFQGA